MKISTLFLCGLLLPTAYAHAQQEPAVRGNASADGQADVSADKGAMGAASSASASASAQTEHASASLAGGTELHAALTKPVDARKNEPGDEVIATATQDVTADGKVVVRKGARLIGRVTEAKPRARAGGSGEGSAQSTLGIVFDRAVLKDGTEVPISASLQAVAATQSSANNQLHASDEMPVTTGSPRGGNGVIGGTLGGVASAAGSATGTVGGGVGITQRAITERAITRSAGAAGGVDAAGHLIAGSKGVFGLKGLELSSTSKVAGEGSVLTSTSRNIRLEKGTRMLLVTSARTTAGKATSEQDRDSSAPVDRDDKR